MIAAMARDDDGSTTPTRSPEHPLETNAPAKAAKGSSKKAKAKPKTTSIVPAKKAATPAPAPPVTPVDFAVAAIRRIKQNSMLTLAIEVGRAVVEHLFKGDIKEARKKGPKDQSLKELSERSDLPISAKQLGISVAIYDMLERGGLIEEVPTWELLTYSHLRALLPAPPKDQERLLREAHDKDWTVRDLDTEIAKVLDPKAKGGGRKRGSAVAKGVKALDAAADRLLTALEKSADVPKGEVKAITAALERASGAIAKVRKKLPK